MNIGRWNIIGQDILIELISKNLLIAGCKGKAFPKLGFGRLYQPKKRLRTDIEQVKKKVVCLLILICLL